MSTDGELQYSPREAGLAVMVATVKTEPMLVMVVPKMEREDNKLIWHGQFHVRAKGYSLSLEDRKALVLLLTAAAAQIEAGIEE